MKTPSPRHTRSADRVRAEEERARLHLAEQVRLGGVSPLEIYVSIGAVIVVLVLLALTLPAILEGLAAILAPLTR